MYIKKIKVYNPCVNTLHRQYHDHDHVTNKHFAA